MATITIKIDSHSQEFLDALEKQIPVALEACGIRAEELAAGACPVDTGLLRNSITYALDGQSPAKGSYHAAYGSSRTKKGNRRSASSKYAGSVGYGSYSGQAQKESGNRRSVLIGTNVEYAIYVELGTSNPKYPKQPFLAPAIKNHVSDYKQILERYLKSGG